MRTKLAITAKDWLNLTEHSTYSVRSLKTGDRISIIQKEGDIEGTIVQLPRFSIGEIKLATNTGIRLIPVNHSTYIHLIKSADCMKEKEKLTLNNHTEYDRDQECFLGNTHQNNGRPEFEPTETDPKTKMIRPKICLNLRKVKKGDGMGSQNVPPTCTTCGSPMQEVQADGIMKNYDSLHMHTNRYGEPAYWQCSNCNSRLGL